MKKIKNDFLSKSDVRQIIRWTITYVIIVAGITILNISYKIIFEGFDSAFSNVVSVFRPPVLVAGVCLFCRAVFLLMEKILYNNFDCLDFVWSLLFGLVSLLIGCRSAKELETYLVVTTVGGIVASICYKVVKILK